MTHLEKIQGLDILPKWQEEIHYGNELQKREERNYLKTAKINHNGSWHIKQ